MSSARSTYHEELLHWIWENRHFDLRQLQTVDGRPLQIHHPGKHNKSDGPDFSGAEITIGELRWYGDIEIHWNYYDWRNHGHHRDTNFNNVVLHVVFQNTDKKSKRQDQTAVPTFSLSNYLSEPLHFFLDRYQKEPELPCAGQLSFISEEAFTRQLKIAHKEYFEQKVDDLLEFYDPSLPPSQAWIKMFSVALCDGLGISHNRTAMQLLATELFDEISSFSDRNNFRIRALQVSGINKKLTHSKFKWNHKGCRPGNHPRLRIQQGCETLWHIYHLPFEQWLQNNPRNLWDDLLNSISTTPSIGKERASILFGTVFLPALYSLGNLFFSDKIKSKSWHLWTNHRAYIPKTLLTQFQDISIPSSVYAQKLGTIHQLRSYCRPRNCKDCKVFKSAISS